MSSARSDATIVAMKHWRRVTVGTATNIRSQPHHVRAPIAQARFEQMLITYVLAASFTYPLGRKWTVLIHTGYRNNGPDLMANLYGILLHIERLRILRRLHSWHLICPTQGAGVDDNPICQHRNRFSQYALMESAHKERATKLARKNVLCSGYVHWILPNPIIQGSDCRLCRPHLYWPSRRSSGKRVSSLHHSWPNSRTEPTTRRRLWASIKSQRRISVPWINALLPKCLIIKAFPASRPALLPHDDERATQATDGFDLVKILLHPPPFWHPWQVVPRFRLKIITLE